MQIFIKMPTNKRIKLDVTADELIYSIKTKIRNKEYMMRFQQRLTFAGQELEDYLTLSHYNILAESTLDLTPMDEGTRTNFQPLRSYMPNLSSGII